MNEQAKKILDSINELKSIKTARFEFVIDDRCSREEKSRIDVNKHRYTVRLLFYSEEGIEVLCDLIAKSYAEMKKMEQAYLHEISHPDTIIALHAALKLNG